MKYLVILMTLCLSIFGCEKEAKEAGAGAGAKKAAVKKKAKEKKKDQDEDTVVDNEEDARTLLVGIWRLDVTSVLPDKEILALPKHEQGPALKQRRSNMQHVAYEFAEDGKLAIFLGGRNAMRGSYDIKKGEKNVLQIEASAVGPIGSKSYRWKVTVNAKTLALKDEKEGGTLRLFRGPPIFKGGD